MRIVAAFFVVLIHSSGLSSVSGIFYSSISRFSVPVFVMISGYYLLAHQIGRAYLAKKICRLFVLMMIWSGIYFIYGLSRHTGSYTGIADLLRFLLTEPVHLWYIYAAVALYLFTPLFQVFCRNANRREYLYALVLTFIFGSVIMILLRAACFPALSAIIFKMKVAYTLGFVFLYLLGGYFQRYGVAFGKRYLFAIYLLGIIGCAATFGGTLLLSRGGRPNDLLQSYFAPNVLAAGIGFFVFVKRFHRRFPIKNNKIRMIVHNLAGCTLGVYLLHPLLLMMLENNMGYYFTAMARYTAIPFQAAIAFILSVILVFMVKRIPVLNFLV